MCSNAVTANVTVQNTEVALSGSGNFFWVDDLLGSDTGYSTQCHFQIGLCDPTKTVNGSIAPFIVVSGSNTITDLDCYYIQLAGTTRSLQRAWYHAFTGSDVGHMMWTADIGTVSGSSITSATLDGYQEVLAGKTKPVGRLPVAF